MGERSARWLRVSTNKKGDKQQDESEQIPAIEQWETSHGYDFQKDYELTVSGFKDNKRFNETWAQVLADVLNGVFTVLVVWKLDRIDRKKQARRMIEEMTAVGGRIEFVTDTDLNGEPTLTTEVSTVLKGHLAYEESKKKQDNALRTLANHRANGAISSRPPFGYAVEGPKHGKYFVIVESLRVIVETIFAKCIAGDSLGTIASWLDAQGIPTARGGKWSVSALKNIINNRAYMGYVMSADKKDKEGNLVKRAEVIGKCPVIIDADRWADANRSLANHPNHGPLNVENRALCSGVLYCIECIDVNYSPMYRIQGNDGPVNKDGSRNKAYWYRCAGRGAQRKGCGNMVRLDIVDAKLDKLMSARNEPIMKREFVRGHNHAKEIADIDFQISQLSPEGLTRAEYRAKQDELWDEKEALQGTPDVPDRWELVDTGETYASRWNTADIDGKRDMLRNVKVLAGKNSDGTVQVFIRERDDDGQLSARWL